jgi:predicted metal-dependent hydrolase
MKKNDKKVGESVSVIKEFEGIPVEVIRRRVKYSRVEFKKERLRVIVPRGVNPQKVLEDNREAILKKHRKLMSQMETARSIPMTEWEPDQFETMVSDCIQKYARQLKVEIRQVKFRKMKRRWGSCRSDGVITLNVFLHYVPEHLVAYIIYHELAHLIVRGHNREFKRIIAAEFPHYRKLDKELDLYGLKLLS